ncbi:MAG: type II toxin-antitoxin system RelB/DinJ family antitoxin [Clostridia bacterium]|nr:type II toxin-antitoxin system RelB/DinJ family antitoxin [Clostridia bacterium]
MTTINIRLDENVKKQATALFADLGLDMSTAINIFLRQAIMHDGLPFAVNRELPNALTLSALAELEEAEKQANKKTYDSFSELLEEVNADV